MDKKDELRPGEELHSKTEPRSAKPLTCMDTSVERLLKVLSSQIIKNNQHHNKLLKHLLSLD